MSVRFASTMVVAALSLVAAACDTAPSRQPAAGEQKAAAPAAAENAAAPAAGEKAAPPPKLAEVFPHDPAQDAPVPRPFGDPWDPTRPPPPTPETIGPGITAAKVVSAGAADVKEIPRPPGKGPLFYGAVVDVTIAPGSTTEVLGGASITLTTAGGEAVPLFAACMPTHADASLIATADGTAIAAWTVEVDGKPHRCGGGNARMVRRVGPGGFRLSAPAAAEWSGPMVLLFEGQADPPKSVTLVGSTIEIPAKQQEK